MLIKRLGGSNTLDPHVNMLSPFAMSLSGKIDPLISTWIGMFDWRDPSSQTLLATEYIYHHQSKSTWKKCTLLNLDVCSI